MTGLYLCLLALSLFPETASARTCQVSLTANDARIIQIVDGDTVVLENQQRVRLIGIDTPEMNASDEQDRLWANKATESLEQMLSGQRVTVLVGADRKDRHGRLLAHLRLPDGRDAASELIAQGLGIAVGVGRNTACAQENRLLELEARSQEKGLWKHKGRWWSDREPRLEADRGFHVIRSKANIISERGRQSTLQLDNGLSIKLGSSWPLNDRQTNDLLTELEHQMIEVRGWLSGRKAMPQLTLHHPANVQMLAR